VLLVIECRTGKASRLLLHIPRHRKDRGRDQRQQDMEGAMHASLKLLGYVIVLLMAIAVLYTAYISVKYWAGIGV
jgi:hypothetical protein